jgi:hypothetical protein
LPLEQRRQLARDGPNVLGLDRDHDQVGMDDGRAFDGGESRHAEIAPRRSRARRG